MVILADSNDSELIEVEKPQYVLMKLVEDYTNKTDEEVITQEELLNYTKKLNDKLEANGNPVSGLSFITEPEDTIRSSSFLRELDCCFSRKLFKEKQWGHYSLSDLGRGYFEGDFDLERNDISEFKETVDEIVENELDYEFN